jgi:hypothetical protein
MYEYEYENTMQTPAPVRNAVADDWTIAHANRWHDFLRRQCAERWQTELAAGALSRPLWRVGQTDSKRSIRARTMVRI